MSTGQIDAEGLRIKIKRVRFFLDHDRWPTEEEQEAFSGSRKWEEGSQNRELVQRLQPAEKPGE